MVYVWFVSVFVVDEEKEDVKLNVCLVIFCNKWRNELWNSIFFVYINMYFCNGLYYFFCRLVCYR